MEDQETWAVPVRDASSVPVEERVVYGNGQYAVVVDAPTYEEAVEIVEEQFDATVTHPQASQFREEPYTPLTESVGTDVPAIVYAEIPFTDGRQGRFGGEYAKTANGVTQHSKVADVRVVIDPAASETMDTAAEALGRDDREDLKEIPLVASFGEAVDVAPEAELFVVGGATEGGYIPDAWEAPIEKSLQRGMTVMAGLHTYLGNDPDYAALAEENGGDIIDVRKPPRPDLLGTADGEATDEAHIVLVGGTDMAVGKRTTAAELVQAAEEAGYDADMVATGQTGIMLGYRGVALDAVRWDSVTGVLEELTHRAAEENDFVFVEGQDAWLHRSYSGHPTLMSGCRPDVNVIADEPSRSEHVAVGGEIPEITRHIEYVDMQRGDAPVVAISTWSDNPGEEQAYQNVDVPAFNVYHEDGHRELFRAIEEHVTEGEDAGDADDTPDTF
ncbi:MAG: DUF1611 domain-containing protein [Candidatus Nanohaloarchaea archaeon]|nr:DUF1611 domain-containing protein [Candidatus Nanohaloarchaea archaeon]